MTKSKSLSSYASTVIFLPTSSTRVRPAQGYRTLPGASFDSGTPSDPIDLQLLLDENLWADVVFEDVFVMQATMLQPVGGMDRIRKAP
jgi:monoamine oxidase